MQKGENLTWPIPPRSLPLLKGIRAFLIIAAIAHQHPRGWAFFLHKVSHKFAAKRSCLGKSGDRIEGPANLKN